MRATILAIPLLSAICQISFGSECVLEGGEVTLYGSINKETFPGAPNYESVEMGDEAESVQILKANKEICVTGTYPDSEQSFKLTNLSKFHLVFDTPYSIKDDAAAETFIVTGHIYSAVTGHHHTPAILEVSRVETASGNVSKKDKVTDTGKIAMKANQGMGGTHSNAKSTTNSTTVPDYCEGFSSEACSRIRAVVEANIRPSYCLDGNVITNSAPNMTSEQLQICNTIAERTYANAVDQRISDARAAVKESWTQYQGIITTIDTGYRCDVINVMSANLAITKIQEFMDDEKAKYGLIGDVNTSIEAATTDAVHASKAEVENGACKRITPAWRGKIRALVSDLMPRP